MVMACRKKKRAWKSAGGVYPAKAWREKQCLYILHEKAPLYEALPWNDKPEIEETRGPSAEAPHVF